MRNSLPILRNILRNWRRKSSFLSSVCSRRMLRQRCSPIWIMIHRSILCSPLPTERCAISWTKCFWMIRWTFWRKPLPIWWKRCCETPMQAQDSWSTVFWIIPKIPQAAWWQSNLCACVPIWLLQRRWAKSSVLGWIRKPSIPAMWRMHSESCWGLFLWEPWFVRRMTVWLGIWWRMTLFPYTH